MKLEINNFKRGFSIFITIIVIAALLITVYAISSTSSKEVAFTNTNRESQIALFAADAGIECALYWDAKYNTNPSGSVFDPTVAGNDTISCGGGSITDGGAIQGTSTLTMLGGGDVGASSGNIAFDSGVHGGYQFSGSTRSWIHTTSGSNRILFVGVESDHSILSVTYNGVAMTQIAATTNNNGANDYLFYLINPALGANTVTVTASASAYIEGVSASYTGALQSGTPLSTAHNGSEPDNTTDFNTTLSTGADNSWTLVFANSTQVSVAAGSGSVLRVNGAPIGSGSGMLDSGGPIHPAGSYTMGVHGSSAGAQSYGVIMVSFSPATTGGAGIRTSTFGFTLNHGSNPVNACAIVVVTKNVDGSTYINSYGYDNCNTSDPRRVERGIQVKY